MIWVVGGLAAGPGGLLAGVGGGAAAGAILPRRADVGAAALVVSRSKVGPAVMRRHGEWEVRVWVRTGIGPGGCECESE